MIGISPDGGLPEAGRGRTLGRGGSGGPSRLDATAQRQGGANVPENRPYDSQEPPQEDQVREAAWPGGFPAGGASGLGPLAPESCRAVRPHGMTQTVRWSGR